MLHSWVYVMTSCICDTLLKSTSLVTQKKKHGFFNVMTMYKEAKEATLIVFWVHTFYYPEYKQHVHVY